MKNRWFICVAATALLGIVIHPTVLWGFRLPNVGFLAWVYLVPLLYYLRVTDGKHPFLSGFSASFLSHAVNLYWFVPAMVNFGGIGKTASVGLLLLAVLILSFFFGMALKLSLFVARKTLFPLFILQALFLTAFDVLRTYWPVKGFPWGLTAYSQAPYLALFQWVDTLGVFGLDFMIYLVNVLIAEILLTIRRPVARDLLVSRSILVGLVVVLSLVGSILRRGETLEATTEKKGKSIALVQGNISQLHKWNPTLARHHFERHFRLTQKAKLGGAELVIWPESAYPFTIPLSDLSDHHFQTVGGTPLPVLFGAVAQADAPLGAEPVIHNSAFLIAGGGPVSAFYHKRHLVPFG